MFLFLPPLGVEFLQLGYLWEIVQKALKNKKISSKAFPPTDITLHFRLGLLK
jgi:transposase